MFRYLKDESGLNRKNIIDNRVHCCFYFVSPYGHGLKPLDIDFMKQLSNKVNYIYIPLTTVLGDYINNKKTFIF